MLRLINRCPGDPIMTIAARAPCPKTATSQSTDTLQSPPSPTFYRPLWQHRALHKGFLEHCWTASYSWWEARFFQAAPIASNPLQSTRPPDFSYLSRSHPSDRLPFELMASQKQLQQATFTSTQRKIPIQKEQ